MAGTTHPSTTLSARESAQVRRANESGRVPVVFVHGPWLLPGSWGLWTQAFEAAGYVALAPDWPGDPPSVPEANAHPQAMADKTVGQVADHLADLCGRLERKPAVIGHSFGGLLAQILAGRGLSATTVAIAPAPSRGVSALAFSALKSAWPVLGNPANLHRAVSLSFEQFRYAFANAVDEAQARRLHHTFAVPAAGAPLFQSATANLNPWTEVRVDADNAERGPLLVVAGGQDHSVPPAVARAAFRMQAANPGLTEFAEVPSRGHSLTIDDGWRDVADLAMGFVRRCAPADVAAGRRGERVEARV